MAYHAWNAEAVARESRRRLKERKIDTDPELRAGAADDPRNGWSPEHIAGRLCYEPSRGRNGHVRIVSDNLHVDLRSAEKKWRVPGLSRPSAMRSANPAAGKSPPVILVN